MPFTTLLIDLDDTLYPASSGLWDAIRDRMNEYMDKRLHIPCDQIPLLRRDYLDRYGTTLRGLQIHHQVDAEDFLAYVHDLPLEEYLDPDPDLRLLLLSLPQRKWIFTNADVHHARRVLHRLGAHDCFDGIIDIHAREFACKPDAEAYLRTLALVDEKDPERCIVFDDTLRNLIPAHKIGFYTVLVGKNGSESPEIDCAVMRLTELRTVMPELWHPPFPPKKP